MNVNAFYTWSENHFFIPLGILQPPYFSPDYPSSVLYGAIGSLIAHEITHGFDSIGVKYDGEGKETNWMDKRTTFGFNKMADCVIKQYDKFTKNGKHTQTEDISDNGGIRAAFNAFLAEESLHGSQPRLPHETLKDFDHRQIFFLSFAQNWCSTNPEVGFPGDVHTPNKYRVMGTLQNFPAFQAAFNCPVGSNYAPKEHCEVWASEVDTHF